MQSVDLNHIPTCPGVYLYKDAGGKVLYVGKAKHLRKRVSSYFRQDQYLTPKTRAMLRAAETIDTISTSTEKEALLLEASLIKKHRPRYNILLRDDKQYVLFSLTLKHEWPRLILTRRVLKDGSRYFGPFTSSYAAKQTWKAVHRVFKLRRCSDNAFRNRVRPCLYHHIGQCYAPCCNDVDREAYLQQVHQVDLLLSGRSSELLDTLRADMGTAAEAMEYEKAAELRDQIRAVEATVEQQAAVLPRRNDMDVLGLAETEKGLALGLLFVRRGVLLDKRNFFWSGLTLDEGPEVLTSFLAQYYGPHSFIPSRIVVPWKIEIDGEDQLATHSEALTDLRGGQVLVVTPRDEAENSLVSMAITNALQDAKINTAQSVSEKLARKMGLPAEPWRIEAVDVSHTGGKNTRVGVVVFEDGKPAKDQYRTYAFDDEDGGGDDYAVLSAWTARRIESGEPWPDLLLIDGGKGQLAAVEKAMEREGKAGLFPLASIAKARDDETGRADRRKGNVEDRIFLPSRSNPVNFKAGSPELLFLQHIRDSVHDYSIGRHRKARAGAALTGELLRIQGIGPSLAKILWERYPSVGEMAEASVEELMQLPGVGRKKAQTIYEGLQRISGNEK